MGLSDDAMTIFRSDDVDETARFDIEDAEILVHAREVGARLRVLRHQLGWSLEDVEKRSSQEITASELRAYEAGERAISFFGFRRLIRLYGVSGDQLRQASTTNPLGGFETDGDDRRVLLPFVDPQEPVQVGSGPVVPQVRAYCVEEGPSVRNHLSIGTAVMVRTRYLRTWTRGFEVAELLGDRYRLRRLSDNSLLGGTFAFEEVLPVSVGA
jgi:transcriptional regulator with XRE-family HTH domain